MDLYCLSEFQIGLIGSMFLVGTFVASFFLPRLGDIYGRKVIFLFGLSLYIAVTIGFIFCTNVYLLYALLFIGGISETGAYYLAYVYCVEFIPVKFQNLAGLGIFLIMAFLKIFDATYFWKISKEWVNMAYMAMGACVVAIVMCFIFLSDSPPFYYSNKKFDLARKTLFKMQIMNGIKEIKEFKFDTEVEEGEKSARVTMERDIINLTAS
mmetsp:Transcript_29041/g.21607  ORF Transcript_29041/g.21607 Transcript_29041/m.21607 type:complete len:210 (+) Transcript_29041:194-823(+)